MRKQVPKQISILVIDDDKHSVETIEKYSQASGYLCHKTHSKNGIYEYLDGFYYDAVFCDGSMQDFDLGLLLKYCLNRFPSIRFIITSCLSPEKSKRYMEFENVVHCLPKPFNVEDFVRYANNGRRTTV